MLEATNPEGAEGGCVSGALVVTLSVLLLTEKLPAASFATT